MDPARERRALEVYRELLGLGPHARDVEFARLCRGDDELHAAVRALGASGDDANEDDEVATAEVGARLAQVLSREIAREERELDALGVPERIGRYRVVRRIGSGATSVVFEAQRDAPSRAVAIKVLTSLARGCDEARPFWREAEILGRLKHPGIAQVHE